MAAVHNPVEQEELTWLNAVDTKAGAEEELAKN